jgi:hypothetical protein
MADCKFLEKCIFFNDQMPTMPSTAEMFKEHYCKDVHQECARFMVATQLDRTKVPKDMFPNEQERAVALIKG